MDNAKNGFVSAHWGGYWDGQMVTTEFDPTIWAIECAKRVLAEQGDSAAISTAEYTQCSLIIEAARLVAERPDIARIIGERMEKPRGLSDDPKSYKAE